MERRVDAGVDKRFDLHRWRSKVGREAAAVLSRQSVEMPLEWRRGGFSEASVQSLWEGDRTQVTFLPGSEVEQGDGDGIAGHQGIAAKEKKSDHEPSLGSLHF